MNRRPNLLSEIVRRLKLRLMLGVRRTSGRESSETSWAFRLRFRLPRTSGLSISAAEAEFDGGPKFGVLRLEVWPRGTGTIDQAEWLVLTGHAASEAEARSRGISVSQAFQRAFSRLRVAADFGASAAVGGLSEYSRRVVENATGRPVLDDEHGLMVYPAEPQPSFVSVGAVTPRLSAQVDRLQVVIATALEQAEPVSDQESIAYDLFAASFFDSSPDARLISLVTAIETLISPPPRSPSARSHVEAMIEATREAASLNQSERDSLVGSLQCLRKESITTTGRKFVHSRVGERVYGDQTARQLWTKAYELRSKLVHGSVPRPSRNDVGRCAANLEVLVAHLLCGRLLEVDV